VGLAGKKTERLSTGVTGKAVKIRRGPATVIGRSWHVAANRHCPARRNGKAAAKAAVSQETYLRHVKICLVSSRIGTDGRDDISRYQTRVRERMRVFLLQFVL